MKLQLATLALLFVTQSVTSSNVPALIWSSKADNIQNNLQYSSQVADINGEDLLSNFVDRNIPVVALVQNSLSVEQFSANNAPFVSSIFKSSQNEPVFYSNVNSIPKSLSTFSEDQSKIGSKNVVINLDGKTIKENDEILKSLSEKYNSTGAVFIFTGKKNEFESTRQKRDTQPVKDQEATIFGGKVKDSTSYCFFFTYMDGKVLYQTSPSESVFLEFDNKNPGIDNVVCATKTNKDIKSYYLNTFDLILTSSNNKKITLKFGFKNTGGNWYVNSLNATIDGNEFKGSNLFFSPGGLSRSCQNETISLMKVDEKRVVLKAFVSLKKFQFQPFVVGDVTTIDKLVFSNSSDCAVWLTLPLISSLIVVLILLTILYSGVRALMSIMTPDRFENPKGKGLIITNFEE